MTTLEFNVIKFPAQYRGIASVVINEMNKFAINDFSENLELIKDKLSKVTLDLGEQGVIKTKHVFIEALHWLLLDRQPKF